MRSGTDSGNDIVKDTATAEIIAAQDDAIQWVDGTSEEKKLVRKLDWRILPCTWTNWNWGTFTLIGEFLVEETI